MDNTTSMQFYLESEQPIGDVLRILAEELRFGVASIDHDDDQAPAFAQIIGYSQGYEQGFLISWPSRLGQADVEIVGERLASSFRCSTLVELDDPADAWLLFTPDGHRRIVSVSILDDGIEIGGSQTIG